MIVMMEGSFGDEKRDGKENNKVVEMNGGGDLTTPVTLPCPLAAPSIAVGRFHAIFGTLRSSSLSQVAKYRNRVPVAATGGFCS